MAHLSVRRGGRSAYSKLDAEQCLDGRRVLPLKECTVELVARDSQLLRNEGHHSSRPAER
jgi:hypothetical protein